MGEAREINAKYIKKIQGRDFILFEGLLDIAHSEGLSSVETELIQAPTQENGLLAIVRATVVTEKGSFSALGDASPESLERPMQPHIVRMADTRAIARAMRLAVNVGMTSSVEMTGESDGPRTSNRDPRGNQSGSSNNSNTSDSKDGWLENPGDVILNFGKHADKKLADVLLEDPTYIEWLAKEAYDYVLRAAAKKLLETGDITDANALLDEAAMEMADRDDTDILF